MLHRFCSKTLGSDNKSTIDWVACNNGSLFLNLIAASVQQGPLFLNILEAGSLGSGCQHGQVLVRALFWAADCQLLYPHMATSRWW